MSPLVTLVPPLMPRRPIGDFSVEHSWELTRPRAETLLIQLGLNDSLPPIGGHGQSIPIASGLFKAKPKAGGATSLGRGAKVDLTLIACRGAIALVCDSAPIIHWGEVFGDEFSGISNRAAAERAVAERQALYMVLLREFEVPRNFTLTESMCDQFIPVTEPAQPSRSTSQIAQCARQLAGGLGLAELDRRELRARQGVPPRDQVALSS